MATAAGTTPSSRNPSFSRLSPHLPPLKDSPGEGEGEEDGGEADTEDTGSEKSVSRNRKKRRSGRKSF